MRSKYKTPPPGSTPPLNPELNTLYNGLDENNKAVFIKVFKFLWGCVCPLSRFIGFSGVLHSFWAVDLLRDQSGLTTSQLSLLTFIYQATDKGKNYILVKSILAGPVVPHLATISKGQTITNLRRLGYLTCAHHIPATATLPRSYSRHCLFIRLSPSGVRLIEDIEKDLHNILMRTSLDELTGTTNKKA